MPRPAATAGDPIRCEVLAVDPVDFCASAPQCPDSG